MTRNKSLLQNFVPKYSRNVRFRTDNVSPIMGYGDIIKKSIKLKKVSFVEGLGHNLFSIGQFCDKDLEVTFKKNSCSVTTKSGDVLLVGTRKSNLYSIDLNNTMQRP